MAKLKADEIVSELITQLEKGKVKEFEFPWCGHIGSPKCASTKAYYNGGNAMTDLYVTWDDYMAHTERLAIKVHDHGYKFNQIVCIAKGGLRVGDIIQRIFDVPLAIMSVESYHGDGVKNQQSGIVFGNSLAKTTPNLGNKV